MQSRIFKFAALAQVDEMLDEFQEEFGDLPEKLDSMRLRVSELQAILDETESITADVKSFISSSKITLIEMKDREEKLAKQQFLVRNNKEFDAITKEIDDLREAHNKLIDELRGSGVKLENLAAILIEQKKDVEVSTAALVEKEKEFDNINSGQNAEVQSLFKLREDRSTVLETEDMKVYNRIRSYHKDAAVQVRKNSCSGCYSAIPPQIIVEIRTRLEDVYTCEQCGRVLYPEELELEEIDL
ncbi:MAG: hypothetical protein KAH48_06360 [Chlorobi bacterium]|nr:hypothetical protein [Chlorobiota bacterium]